jgi:tetratricopeptide (TPR) repeat protein
MKYKFQHFIPLIITLFLILTGLKPTTILAQNQDINPPEINPLEIRERDILLPSIDRPLTDFELKRLRRELDELNQQGKAELEAGNIDQAFTIWYRELRVTRVFGAAEEIEKLTKLGAIAWEKARNQDVNYITERLLILQTENTSETGEINEELIFLFAEAYETIHNLDKSIEIYQKILNSARKKEDKKTIKLALDKLGVFYLSKFKYYEAEPIYEELLMITRAEENYLEEGIYLRKLAEINGETANPKNSVTYKEQLAENYLANQQLISLADLKISIADDYKALDRPEEASKYYQEAFALAWSLEKFATAGDALKKLGRLYQDYKQNEYALQIYQELIKIEQQSYNLYGLMNTYDYIGQIYLQDNNYPLALQWFKKALEIALHLKYKVDYFNSKIQQVNEQINLISPDIIDN